MSESSLRRYERHLGATAAWLVRSIEHGRGGSCAYFSLAGRWSNPYPETTGYLIPCMIELSRHLRDFDGERRAVGLGEWLLSIQDRGGWWHGLTHPPKENRGSVFNTAQVLQGLVALGDLTGQERWLESASRAAHWLAEGVADDGLWPGGDYRAAQTPSYYSYAAWPMLEVAERSGDAEVRRVARGVLEKILERRRDNGTLAEWGFAEGEAAFTHTIAYTIQGFMETARLLDDWPTFGEPMEKALVALARRGELAGGRLPGRLDDAWAPAARYVCLTGNSQVAICLLDWERRRPDLRLVSAAARLSDVVCAAQAPRSPIPGFRAAIAGSSPVWGRYQPLRYPNWAAKYHCEALMRLIPRLREEWER